MTKWHDWLTRGRNGWICPLTAIGEVCPISTFLRCLHTDQSYVGLWGVMGVLWGDRGWYSVMGVVWCYGGEMGLSGRYGVTDVVWGYRGDMGLWGYMSYGVLWGEIWSWYGLWSDMGLWGDMGLWEGLYGVMGVIWVIGTISH